MFMYPVEIKKTKCKATFLEALDNIFNFIITGLGCFRSLSSLIIFLEKSFYF